MTRETIDVQFLRPDISDTDLVEEADQNRLMFWRDTFRTGEFDIGDIANKQCIRSAKMGFPATQERIFRAVGRFCGKSGRTVRYYCETARFYPEWVREEYNTLPFAHFVFARYCGERWLDVLNYARDHPNISEDGLRYVFVEAKDQAIPMEDVFARVDTDREDGVCESHDRTDPIQPPITAKEPASAPYLRAVSTLSGVLEQLEKILKWFNLKPQTVERVNGLMQEFRDIIPEIVKEISGE